MKWPLFTMILFAFLAPSGSLNGQFYYTGESPASLRWNQLTTKHFKIVYPRNLTRDASLLAGKLEYYYEPGMGDLKRPMNKKFPVLINNASVLSNGFVTLAPARMELVITPPQDGYPQDWISQLTLHEFRHVAQLNRMDQGFTHAFTWLTGQIIPGIVSSQIQPWFYEGDAVFNETRLSGTGRGRIPGFEMPLRTLLLENQHPYSYDQAFFGSYRYAVPDHYCLGYPMVSYARSKFGADTWAKALDYTARHPFFIWPMAFYLKKNFGIYKSGLYHATLDSLKQQYIKQKDSLTLRSYSAINHRNNTLFTSYLLPKDLGNGNVIALRSGLNDPGSIVRIDSTGETKVLFSTGRTTKQNSDLFGNTLVWDEVVSDPRWEQRNYSEIRIADLSNGRVRSLTRKSRYFSPAFSPDGHRIAVAETDIQNHHFMSVLDASSGQCFRQIPSPGNRALQFPEWVNQTDVAVVTVSERGKQLEMVNTETGQWSVILHNTLNDISEPVHYRNYLLFRGSFTGIENIYAVNKTNAALLYQVTFSAYGAYHPEISIDSTRLLFSNYTRDGFDVACIPLDTNTWVRTGTDKTRSPTWIGNAGARNVIADVQADTGSTLKPYRKGSHLFNIHSWIPLYTDLEDITHDFTESPIRPGVMLFSQNLLSTVISSFSYTYDQGYHQFIPSIRWSGWYPVVELTGQLGGPLLRLSMPDGAELPDNPQPYYEYTLKTYIPFRFDRGAFITLVQPRIEYQQMGVWYYSGSGLSKGIDFLHFKFNIQHYSRLSQRDLYPTWGQFITAAFTETPLEKGQYGDMFSVQALTFFPGLARHHHLSIQGGYQLQRTRNYFIPVNRVDFPRGFNTSVSEEFTSVILNYSFTIGYPDLSLGPLLYLKRLRMNLFHDWSYGVNVRDYINSRTGYYTGTYQSLGTEVMADLHLIRILFPVSAGIRLGYMPDKSRYFSELILNIHTGVF